MVAEPVEIESADRVVLRGELSGTGERWVLLVHDVEEDLDSLRPMQAVLLEAQFRVLALDLRGHGASDGEWSAEGAIQDLAAAFRYCRAAGAAKVYAVGAGAGATAAILAAGEEHVDALVCLSPLPELEGIDPRRLRVSRAPKLLSVGATDPEAMAAAQTVYKKVIGWRVLESRAISEQGSALLHAPGKEHIFAKTVTFFRDY